MTDNRYKTNEDEILLLRRIVQRDEDALELLYDRYARLLYSVILKIVKQQQDAQDLLQEVFLQIWNNAAGFDPSRGTPYAWLMALTRNRSIDMIRSKSYRTKQREDNDLDGMLELPDVNLTPMDATLAMERRQVVIHAMAQLPPEQQEVLRLAYFEGYSHTEIAAEYLLPLGTVKTRIRQGLQKLHTIIQQKLGLDR